MTLSAFLGAFFITFLWVSCFTFAINGFFRMFSYVFREDHKLPVDFKSE